MELRHKPPCFSRGYLTHDKKDKPDPNKLKQDLELVEIALSDPLADPLLKNTPRKLRAIKLDSDDKKKKK